MHAQLYIQRACEAKCQCLAIQVTTSTAGAGTDNFVVEVKSELRTLSFARTTQLDHARAGGEVQRSLKCYLNPSAPFHEQTS